MSATKCAIVNYMSQWLLWDGDTYVSPNGATTLIDIVDGAVSLTCPALPSQSCNLLSVQPLLVPVDAAHDGARLKWMYSDTNVVVGSATVAATCASGYPFATSGAFAFLCFALVTLARSGEDFVLTLKPYVPGFVRPALFQMIGNPTRASSRALLGSGVFNYMRLITQSRPNPYLALVPNVPFMIGIRNVPSVISYLILDSGSIEWTNNALVITSLAPALFFYFAFISIDADTGTEQYGLYNGAAGAYIALDAVTNALKVVYTASEAVPVGVVMDRVSQLDLTYTLLSADGAAGVVMMFLNNGNIPLVFNAPNAIDKSVAKVVLPSDIDFSTTPGLVVDDAQRSHTVFLTLPSEDMPTLLRLRTQGALNCFNVNTVGCPGGSAVDGSARCFFKDTAAGGLLCTGLQSAEPGSEATVLQEVIDACAQSSFSSCSTLDGLPLASCTGWKALQTQTLCAEACAFGPAQCDVAKVAYCAAHPDMPECACLYLASNPTPAATFGRSYSQYVCGLQEALGLNPDTEYHGQCWWPLCDPQGGALTLSTTQSSSACPRDIAECYTLLSNNVHVNVSSIELHCGLNASSSSALQCGALRPSVPRLPPRTRASSACTPLTGGGGGGSGRWRGRRRGKSAAPPLSLPPALSGLVVPLDVSYGIFAGLAALLVVVFIVCMVLYFRDKQRRSGSHT